MTPPPAGLWTGKFIPAPASGTLLGVCGVFRSPYLGGIPPPSPMAEEGVAGPPRGVEGPPGCLLSGCPGVLGPPIL